MKDLVGSIPDVTKLVPIPVLLEMYSDRYGEDLPYVTIWAAAKNRRIPAFKFANRVVFQMSDVNRILAQMNTRKRSALRGRKKHETRTQ